MNRDQSLSEIMKWLRLWLATRLLGFMAPDYCLVKALRSTGDVQWDGGKISCTGHVIPVGLFELVKGSE